MKVSLTSAFRAILSGGLMVNQIPADREPEPGWEFIILNSCLGVTALQGAFALKLGTLENRTVFKKDWISSDGILNALNSERVKRFGVYRLPK